MYNKQILELMVLTSLALVEIFSNQNIVLKQHIQVFEKFWPKLYALKKTKAVKKVNKTMIIFSCFVEQFDPLFPKLLTVKMWLSCYIHNSLCMLKKRQEIEAQCKWIFSYVSSTVYWIDDPLKWVIAAIMGQVYYMRFFKERDKFSINLYVFLLLIKPDFLPCFIENKIIMMDNHKPTAHVNQFEVCGSFDITFFSLHCL